MPPVTSVRVAVVHLAPSLALSSVPFSLPPVSVCIISLLLLACDRSLIGAIGCMPKAPGTEVGMRQQVYRIMTEGVWECRVLSFRFFLFGLLFRGVRPVRPC